VEGVEAVGRGMGVAEAPEEVGRSSQVHIHFFPEPIKLLLEQAATAAKAVFILIQLKMIIRRVLQMARMDKYLQLSISWLQMVVRGVITDVGKLVVMVG